MSPRGRKRILLAELDDRLAISLLARLYEHNRSHDVLLSRTADVTHALLESERFSVLVIHAHPSKPGDIAQLERVLRSAAETRIVALIDGEVDASAAGLYAAGADAVRQASGSVTELADQVIQISRADKLLEGRLDQVGAPELVQMLCLCRRTLMIRIETETERAAVWLSNGEIHHAVGDGCSGLGAMSRVVRAQNGRFWAIGGCAVPMRSIHQDWQHVMLEAAREGDEAAQQSQLRQKEAARESVAPHHSQVRKLGKTYRELTELGLQAIKAGDFSKAREYWDAARAIGPEGAEALTSSRPPALPQATLTRSPSAPPSAASRASHAPASAARAVRPASVPPGSAARPASAPPASARPASVPPGNTRPASAPPGSAARPASAPPGSGIKVAASGTVPRKTLPSIPQQRVEPADRR